MYGYKSKAICDDVQIAYGYIYTCGCRRYLCRTCAATGNVCRLRSQNAWLILASVVLGHSVCCILSSVFVAIGRPIHCNCPIASKASYKPRFIDFTNRGSWAMQTAVVGI